MTLKSAVVKTGIAVVALTAMGLIAALPASAHTNNMYTLLQWEGEGDEIGFATYSKTDGTAAFIGQLYEGQMLYIAGIEVAGEKGTIVGGGDGSGFVQEWDHNTGVASPEAPVLILTIPGEERDYFLQEYVGLDTLNDGTTVLVIGYEVEVAEGDFDQRIAIASVNSTNGQVTPLVDITSTIVTEEGVFLYEPTSLATDPLTGTTYVFLEDNAGQPLYLDVNVAAGTFGTPILFGGLYYVEGAVMAADFEADGTMFVNYRNYDEGQLELLKLGAASTWATGEPTYISLAPAQYPESGLFEHSLTIEHTALAATGSELPILAIVLVGTVAVLAGGVTVTVARRRAEAGTV